MTLRIVTNNVPRLFIAWDDLTSAEQDDYNWIEEDDRRWADFVRYKGNIYCLRDFMRTPGSGPLSAWDGVIPDTYFSGTLIRICSDDNDYVVMGHYYQ